MCVVGEITKRSTEQAIKMGKKDAFKVGNLVFAKVKGYPAWPAKVSSMRFFFIRYLVKVVCVLICCCHHHHHLIMMKVECLGYTFDVIKCRNKSHANARFFRHMCDCIALFFIYENTKVQTMSMRHNAKIAFFALYRTDYREILQAEYVSSVSNKEIKYTFFFLAIYVCISNSRCFFFSDFRLSI